jgi:DNA invertase Pin-like site-specific DNA recombinase
MSRTDLTAQRDALEAMGVEVDRVYVDHGLTGANRAGDTLVVTKLDRLARSLPDARDIADELTRREVRLNLGGSVYDPTDPGRAAAVQRVGHGRRVRGGSGSRTREGMKVAKAKGRLRGRQPKLTPRQEAHLVQLHRAGEHTTGELAELFGVARSTVYRALDRAQRPGRVRPKSTVMIGTAG